MEDEDLKMYVTGFDNGYSYALRQVQKDFYPVRKWTWWTMIILMLLQDATIFYNLLKG